jgi:hypothetical protein
MGQGPHYNLPQVARKRKMMRVDKYADLPSHAREGDGEMIDRCGTCNAELEPEPSPDYSGELWCSACDAADRCVDCNARHPWVHPKDDDPWINTEDDEWICPYCAAWSRVWDESQDVADEVRALAGAYLRETADKPLEDRIAGAVAFAIARVWRRMRVPGSRG